MISLQEFADWMKYSISAHNSQPFQISEKNGTFQIWCDSNRLLPVADPHHKDLFTSLGALFETLNAFSSAKNKNLEIISRLENVKVGTPLLEFKVLDGKSQGFVNLNLYEKRFSYRGLFSKRLQREKQKISTENGYLVEDSVISADIAKLFDEVNFQAMTSKGYVEELYQWLRFSPNHLKWSSDGLNSEAMALHGIENWGASKVLMPSVFRFLSSVGLAKSLVQESDKITSALGLWVIWAPKSSDAFDCGRIFQREWVSLTGHDLFGAPLSVLTDREDKADILKKTLGLRDDQKLVNILRVGYLEQSYTRYKPARKHASENIKA